METRGLRIRLGKRLDTQVRRYAAFRGITVSAVVGSAIIRARKKTRNDAGKIAEMIAEAEKFHSGGGSDEIAVPGFVLADGETLDFVRAAVSDQYDDLTVTPEMLDEARKTARPGNKNGNEIGRAHV